MVNPKGYRRGTRYMFSKRFRHKGKSARAKANSKLSGSIKESDY